MDLFADDMDPIPESANAGMDGQRPVESIPASQSFRAADTSASQDLVQETQMSVSWVFPCHC